jgi:hypothetical protein
LIIDEPLASVDDSVHGSVPDTVASWRVNSVLSYRNEKFCLARGDMTTFFSARDCFQAIFRVCRSSLAGRPDSSPFGSGLISRASPRRLTRVVTASWAAIEKEVMRGPSCGSGPHTAGTLHRCDSRRKLPTEVPTSGTNAWIRRTLSSPLQLGGLAPAAASALLE